VKKEVLSMEIDKSSSHYLFSQARIFQLNSKERANFINNLIERENFLIEYKIQTTQEIFIFQFSQWES